MYKTGLFRSNIASVTSCFSFYLCIMHETILILDFGSQYTQLIARRIRELNVYCEIHPFNHIPEIGAHIKGVILSGSPFSVRDENSPAPDLSAFRGKFPILGVCMALNTWHLLMAAQSFLPG